LTWELEGGSIVEEKLYIDTQEIVNEKNWATSGKGNATNLFSSLDRFLCERGDRSAIKTPTD